MRPCTPTRSEPPPRDGSIDLAEDPSVPEGQAKSEQAPIRRPRRARRATAPERVKRPFLLDRARPVFFLGKTEKKMGGASWLDKPPAGAETLWPPSGGPYHLNPSGRCVPTGNPQTPQSSLPRQSSRAHRDNALRFHNIDMPAGLSPGIPPFLAVFFFGFCGALSAAVQKIP